jgi:hypothetical protein
MSAVHNATWFIAVFGVILSVSVAPAFSAGEDGVRSAAGLAELFSKARVSDYEFLAIADGVATTDKGTIDSDASDLTKMLIASRLEFVDRLPVGAKSPLFHAKLRLTLKLNDEKFQITIFGSSVLWVTRSNDQTHWRLRGDPNLPFRIVESLKRTRSNP